MRVPFASLLVIAGCAGTTPGTDAGGLDVAAALDAGTTPDAPAEAGPCTRDDECTAGAEWCVGGRCEPCDNSGLLCDILCADGWTTYVRNGCAPCECAPPDECTQDADCGPSGQHCYAGAFCTDWCAPGDPSCCHGNTCGTSGCTDPSPAGCVTRGCRRGFRCDSSMCASSSCVCAGGTWSCTRDCGGGVCVPE